jgi:hypothetical protein
MVVLVAPSILNQQAPGIWTVPPLRQSDRIARVCLSGLLIHCRPVGRIAGDRTQLPFSGKTALPPQFNMAHTLANVHWRTSQLNTGQARRGGSGKTLWLVAGVVLAAAIALVAWQIRLANSTAAEDIQSGRYAAALAKLQPNAEAGDPWSQNQLGNLYMLGLGTEVNIDEALKWYMRSALNNWADAQINVSLMYRYGRGVKLDLVRAYAWLRHARSNGKEIAEIYMSWMAGSLELTPSHMQVAREQFYNLDSLRPEGFE